MGLTAERREERGGRWKEREIFLTSGWEEEEDGNGTFGEKKKTERWAAKGRTRDTDKEEEEERLSFFFFRFGCWKGFASFLKGTMWRKKIRQKKRTLNFFLYVSLFLLSFASAFFFFHHFSSSSLFPYHRYAWLAVRMEEEEEEGYCVSAAAC